MLDHVGVNVSDIAASRAVYVAALEPLGIKPIMEFEGIACGFGDDQKPAATAAGMKDNGEPGLRPYHEHYYGAFVLDPDGNNIEAVCHYPER